MKLRRTILTTLFVLLCLVVALNWTFLAGRRNEAPPSTAVERQAQQATLAEVTRRIPVAVGDDRRMSEPTGIDELPADEPATETAVLPQPSGAYTVRGQTRVRSTQHPAAGVAIRVNGSSDSESATISDESGCFSIAVPDTGFWFLEVGGDAWAIDTFADSFVLGTFRGPCGAILEVRPSAVVIGRVVGPGGVPVREGYVAAYDDDGRAFIGDPRENGDVLTRILGDEGYEHLCAVTARGPLDDNGSFRLDGAIAEEPVHLFVHSNDVLPDFHTTLVLSPGETREVVIEVPPASRIRGRVVLPRLPTAAEDVRKYAFFRGSTDFRRSPLAEDGSFSSVPLWPSELYEGRLIVETRIGSVTKLWIHVFRTPLAKDQVLDLDLGDVEWKILLPGEVVDWRDYQH